MLCSRIIHTIQYHTREKSGINHSMTHLTLSVLIDHACTFYYVQITNETIIKAWVILWLGARREQGGEVPQRQGKLKANNSDRTLEAIRSRRISDTLKPAVGLLKRQAG